MIVGDVMKAGDLVRIRKSHKAVQRWRNGYRRRGHPFIGKWAEEGSHLFVLKKCDKSGRLRVLGPEAQLASFDEDLLIGIS